MTKASLMPKKPLSLRPCAFLLWALLIVALLPARHAQANVYATDVRLNGGFGNATLVGTNNLQISYILNESATEGVEIDIKNGATVVRAIVLTNTSPGTLKGANVVAWDGTDNNGTNVAAGTYTVSITAAAIGYSDWTQISDDANTNNYVWEPRGIAVNQNASSRYYGRVFVGNAHVGINPDSNTGDKVGMQKFNADASAAEEGVFSDGGWPWAGDYYSPWKIEVSADDKVYINDWTASGIILSFDQTLSAASRKIILNTNNYPSTNVNLSGPFITGTGTNTQVWMADTTYPGSVGIRRWQVSTNGSIVTNNTGTAIVAAGTGSDLDLYPWDVAVDRSNRIYTIQLRFNSGDTSYRVFRFPAYAGTTESNADWKIGSADDTMEGANGIAVDPTGQYVAVAFIGDGQAYTSRQNASTRVFAATNGASIVTLTPAPFHDHTDVAWDNAGNLYTTDNFDSVWRIFSPPGTNQSTTVALGSVQIASAVPPLLSNPAYSGGQFQFTLNGQANLSYIIQASTDLRTWAPVATNVSASASRPISIAAPASQSFYRALVGQ